MCVYKEGVVVQGLVKISGRCRPIHQIFNFHEASGTMGTGANVDVIVPHTINSYSDGGDAEAASRTSSSGARAKFGDLFVSPASQLQQFLEDPEGFISGLQTKIEQHERIGALERGVDTLKAIKDLAAQTQRPRVESPSGQVTKSGEPFWSGHKIFPEALEFDPQKPLHKEFLIAATNLYACVCKVHPTKYPSKENKLHIKRPPGSCPSASSGHEGYSYVSVSPDGRLLVAESFVWDMHRLTCKQHVPVTATDMVWTKDGRHLICPSYSRVYICGLGVREAERTIIFEDPFLGAELACAAASGGVIERWQKLGQPSTLLAEWRADAVDNDKEVVQDMDEEEASGEVEAETASKERVQPKEVTGVRVPRIAAFADRSQKFVCAYGNTVHFYLIEHRSMTSSSSSSSSNSSSSSSSSSSNSSSSSSGVSSALTRVVVLDDLFVDEAEPNANMTAATMATHPTDDSLLAIDTARGDVFVCDVANHNVLSKLKVSRNAPVKFGVFARHSSVLLVNSVESVIKCDYSTEQFDLCHLRPTTDPRCRPYVIVPIVVPPATPPADTQMLDDYDITTLPYLTSSAKHFDMAKKTMEAAASTSFVLDCLIHLA
ncbi:hypothetical protein PTSG_10407 [Salpingoeca rosetta]|uniref:Ubiquitin-activating enzyme SCCH domain-containing protein n=1 Tax=Salpingoeca rosetta (strain ATCC 50818 / BSB-021) TaxID=946362 RepID=F2UPK2_SALR5|nr:uncharacterized protein PTSG_10407 [Salpingoeca rosetta]EGD79557.1 hypothetical protein PTSG_10407 [Salpingoeca rosetta]|eukprot:XP_004988785.1 hypothetical protein PTSG_10407 [Salpingoeca rosetta]